MTEIANDNTHRYWISLSCPDPDSGVIGPATGKSVTAYLATSKDGDALDNTTVALSELSGVPGDYSGVLAASIVDTAIAAGARYEVYTISGEFRLAHRLDVRETRTA